MSPEGRDLVDAKLLEIQRQEASQRRARKATNPVVEIADDVLDLLAAFAKERSVPLDQAANGVLARWLYRAATVG